MSSDKANLLLGFPGVLGLTLCKTATVSWPAGWPTGQLSLCFANAVNSCSRWHQGWQASEILQSGPLDVSFSVVLSACAVPPPAQPPCSRPAVWHGRAIIFPRMTMTSAPLSVSGQQSTGVGQCKWASYLARNKKEATGKRHKAAVSWAFGDGLTLRKVNDGKEENMKSGSTPATRHLQGVAHAMEAYFLWSCFWRARWASKCIWENLKTCFGWPVRRRGGRS